MRFSFSRFVPLCLLALYLCTGLACDSGGTRASVSGKVTFKGQPVAEGGLNISFLGQDGKAVSGEVGTDGIYSVSGVHVGEARISVYGMVEQDADPLREELKSILAKGDLTEEDQKKVEKLKMDLRKGKPKAKGSIPSRYADPKTSNLKTQIEKGKNEYNVDLKEK